MQEIGKLHTVCKLHTANLNFPFNFLISFFVAPLSTLVNGLWMGEWVALQVNRFPHLHFGEWGPTLHFCEYDRPLHFMWNIFTLCILVNLVEWGPPFPCWWILVDGAVFPLWWMGYPFSTSRKKGPPFAVWWILVTGLPFFILVNGVPLCTLVNRFHSLHMGECGPPFAVHVNMFPPLHFIEKGSPFALQLK